MFAGQASPKAVYCKSNKIVVIPDPLLLLISEIIYYNLPFFSGLVGLSPLGLSSPPLKEAKESYIGTASHCGGKGSVVFEKGNSYFRKRLFSPLLDQLLKEEDHGIFLSQVKICPRMV